MTTQLNPKLYALALSGSDLILEGTISILEEVYAQSPEDGWVAEQSVLRHDVPLGTALKGVSRDGVKGKLSADIMDRIENLSCSSGFGMMTKLRREQLRTRYRDQQQ